jgi:hypothetical protein
MLHIQDISKLCHGRNPLFRQRIETLISQLKGQLSPNVIFAKLFEGLAAGILPEITALPLIQYLNFFAFHQSMNLIKTNLF